MSNFSVRTVPADGPAPLGAGASAGTVMAKVGSRIYMGLALKGLKGTPFVSVIDFHLFCQFFYI